MYIIGRLVFFEDKARAVVKEKIKDWQPKDDFAVTVAIWSW